MIMPTKAVVRFEMVSPTCKHQERAQFKKGQWRDASAWLVAVDQTAPAAATVVHPPTCHEADGAAAPSWPSLHVCHGAPHLVANALLDRLAVLIEALQQAACSWGRCSTRVGGG